MPTLPDLLHKLDQIVTATAANVSDIEDALFGAQPVMGESQKSSDLGGRMAYLDEIIDRADRTLARVERLRLMIVGEEEQSPIGSAIGQRAIDAIERAQAGIGIAPRSPARAGGTYVSAPAGGVAHGAGAAVPGR